MCQIKIYMQQDFPTSKVIHLFTINCGITGNRVGIALKSGHLFVIKVIFVLFVTNKSFTVSITDLMSICGLDSVSVI